MKRLIYSIVIIVLTLFVLAGCQFKPQNYEETSEEWTIDKGIDYLEWARDCHISYIEHPDWCNSTSGDIEWNKKLVSEYQQIINWLNQLKEKEDY